MQVGDRIVTNRDLFIPDVKGNLSNLPKGYVGTIKQGTVNKTRSWIVNIDYWSDFDIYESDLTVTQSTAPQPRYPVGSTVRCLKDLSYAAKGTEAVVLGFYINVNTGQLVSGTLNVRFGNGKIMGVWDCDWELVSGAQSTVVVGKDSCTCDINTLIGKGCICGHISRYKHPWD